MSLQNASVRARLYSGFATVVGLLLVLQAVVYASFSRQEQAVRWNQHTYTVMIEIDAILTSLVNIETGQRGFAITGSNTSLEPYVAGVTDFKNKLERARLLTSDNAQKQQRFRKLDELQRNWLGSAINPVIAQRRQVLAGAAAIDTVIAVEQEGRGKRDMDAMRLLLAEARSAEADLLARRDRAALEQTGWTKSMIVLGSVVGVLLGALCAVWITRSLMRSLGGEPAYAAAVANAIAGGDLTVEVETKAGDSASLLYAMKQMRNSLVKIVGEVRIVTDSIASSSRQVAGGSMDLSSRTEQQASALEETASSMEELTATVGQNADNSRTASAMAASAASVAHRGGGVVAEVVATMDGINQSSRQIVDIISVIDSIAFQTNILALNAAVEAARAGEQGRGFAVVASEVRNLAQRSAGAAKEIKQLITDSVDKVESGSRLVDQAGATMQEIVSSIRRVTDIMSEITAASQEQAAGIDQVNTAVIQMDEGTQQNAALVEEAAAAAQSMQEQAASLARLVSIFTLPERTSVPTVKPSSARLPARDGPRWSLPAPARGTALPHGEQQWEQL